MLAEKRARLVVVEEGRAFHEKSLCEKCPRAPSIFGSASGAAAASALEHCENLHTVRMGARR